MKSQTIMSKNWPSFGKRRPCGAHNKVCIFGYIKSVANPSPTTPPISKNILVMQMPKADCTLRFLSGTLRLNPSKRAKTTFLTEADFETFSLPTWLAIRLMMVLKLMGMGSDGKWRQSSPRLFLQKSAPLTTMWPRRSFVQWQYSGLQNRQRGFDSCRACHENKPASGWCIFITEWVGREPFEGRVRSGLGARVATKLVLA